jgi:hypothetical protein
MCIIKPLSFLLGHFRAGIYFGEYFYGWVGLALPKQMKLPKPRPSPPLSETALAAEKTGF